MKLYTEEQIREVLSNMLLTTKQVESILKELSPQDPAICEYSGLPPVEYYSSREITVEDIHKIHKEMSDKELEEGVYNAMIVDLDTEEGEKLAEAYKRGYADGYQEGWNDSSIRDNDY